MDLVLNKLPFKLCLVYLDDTIVYSKSFDEHLGHLDEIFSRLVASVLKLNQDKCEFAAEEVNYLGYRISSEGISPDPDKVKVISEMQFSRSPKEMLRFLGAANFYREFIHKFNNIATVCLNTKNLTQLFICLLFFRPVNTRLERHLNCVDFQL